MSKRIFFLLACFIFISTALQAQFIRSYGIKVGGSLAKQVWDYSTNYSMEPDNRFGLNIGGFVEFLDIPFLSVIAEADYAQKGMKLNIPTTGPDSPDIIGTTTLNNRIDYLSLFLLGKIRYNLVLFSPYLIVGPRADIELGKDIEKGFETTYKDFKKGNFGLTVGVGTELIKVLPLSLLAEFRYNYDLSNVYSNENVKIKNQSFDFLIGVFF
jgi:hypothetical protein